LSNLNLGHLEPAERALAGAIVELGFEILELQREVEDREVARRCRLGAGGLGEGADSDRGESAAAEDGRLADEAAARLGRSMGFLHGFLLIVERSRWLSWWLSNLTGDKPRRRSDSGSAQL
jgi:hypothetical protein